MVIQMNEAIRRARSAALGIVSCACALFMLCALPLLFHDAFFDINRFKVNAVYAVVPLLSLAFLFALAVHPKRIKALPMNLSVLSPLLLALACLISYAMSNWNPAVLTGNQGRYCGLYFWLACLASCFMIAAGENDVVCRAASLVAGGIAALGIANALGYDPLGFYSRIRADQKPLFLSTIGNTDFFGAYLTMIFPLAGARFVLARRGRYGSLALAVVMAAGVASSRTDSPLLALHLCCAVLFVLSGQSNQSLSRALLLWGGCWFVTPLLQPALLRAGQAYSGLTLVLCQTHLGLVCAGSCLAGAVFCFSRGSHNHAAPGRQKVLLAVVAVALTGLILWIAAMVFFTWVNPQYDLGAAESLLRMNDSWGSRRGFVYLRSLRAYADYSVAQKLFGRGLDLAQSILSPYFDRPEMLAQGTFNDAHCQPLQMLLTCGAFGAFAFLALYGSTLFLLIRRCRQDVQGCGLIASLAGYGVIMMFNVTQPILIAVYLALCGLAVCRIRQPKEGIDHES